MYSYTVKCKGVLYSVYSKSTPSVQCVKKMFVYTVYNRFTNLGAYMRACRSLYARLQEIICAPAGAYMRACRSLYARLQELICAPAGAYMRACGSLFARLQEFLCAPAGAYMRACRSLYARLFLNYKRSKFIKLLNIKNIWFLFIQCVIKAF